MKKIFISLLAVAALASCTKSEVAYDDPSEIGFAPVTKMSTKAVADGTDYPDELNMFVFANAGAAGSATTTYTEVYFQNARFANKANGVFAGSPDPYYWPNVKKLIFSGVSASGNVNAATNGSVPTYALTNGAWNITLANYAPGTGSSTTGSNDLMWFPTTAAYGKADVMGTNNDGDIDVQMKHACSWITIKVKGDSVTGRADDDATNNVDETTTWKVKSLTINNLSLTGTATLGETASWSNLATTKGVFNVFASDEGTVLTTTAVELANVANNTVVIPQAPTTLTIVYEFVSQKAGGANGADIVIEETKTVDLTLADTVTGENGAKGGNWLPGKHYIYTVTIGTQEILIEPTAADWDDVTVTPDIAI